MLAGHITAFDQNKVDLNLFDSAVAVEGVIITQPRGGKLQARKTKLGGMLKVPHTHTHTHTRTHARTHTYIHTQATTLTHTHTHTDITTQIHYYTSIHPHTDSQAYTHSPCTHTHKSVWHTNTHPHRAFRWLTLAVFGLADTAVCLP